MQQNPASRFQSWLIVFLIVIAVLLSLIIFWLTRGNNSAPNQATLGAAQDSTSSVVASNAITVPTVTSVPSSASGIPTPTFVPVGAPATNQELPVAPPTDAPTTQPSQPTPIPPTPQPPRPTPIPPTPQPQPTTAPVPVAAQGTTVELDDNVWGGGYRSARGYGGRSATWIYGAGTNYSSMQALFTVDAQPAGTASLTIEGMDSEDRGKTLIQILINGQQVFNAPNPLPNDDLPLDTGTWASATFTFDAALLQPGENTIQINNLKSGEFSLPPFFMLDYAILSFK